MPVDLSLALTYGAIFLLNAFFHSSRVGLTPISRFLRMDVGGIVTFVLCYVLTGTRLDVSAKYLWVQCVSDSIVRWFRRGLDDQVETEDERDQRSSMETMNCQSKTKTKLRSTTDTEAILIVESSTAYRNKYTQLHHYESYGKSEKVREQ